MEPPEQAEAILALRHAKYRQVDSVDPRQKGNKMVEVDTLVADIKDAKNLADEIGD